MAQALPRLCPQCGTPTRANMRLCPTCGLRAEAMLSHPANIQGGSKDFAPQGSAPESAHVPPKLTQIQQGQQPRNGPDFSPISSATQEARETLNDPVEEWPTQIASDFAPASPAVQEAQETPNDPIEERPTQVAPSVGAAPLAPQEAQETLNDPVEEWPTQVTPSVGAASPAPQEAQKATGIPSGSAPSWAGQNQTWPMSPPIRTSGSQMKRWRRTSIVLVLLSILLVLGGGGCLVYSLAAGHIPGLSPSQSQIKTTPMNIAINYAGIDITILNVQQSQNFIDDPETADDGMLRLNLQEQNKTTAPISWSYKTSARLIVPGSPATVPVYVTSKGSIAPGATQKSSIDFPIANGGNLNKLIFQLGASNEAQIQIPLTGQTKPDQYQPRTSQQNGTMTYLGLNWTLTSVTTSLSIPGRQAPSGMEFLTLTLKVDSTLSQEAITGSSFDYLRVQAGGKTVGPQDTTLPVFFAAGETGQTGTATFLIPRGSQACTLILLSQDPGNSGQASTDFQIS